MKKVLFATTALVLTAGVAAADVAVSGDGRMGVLYDGADWNFSSRVRVAFSLSGQTDGGLDFGGSIRADNSAGGAAGTAGEVWISGAFGKIEMGNVVSAPEALFGDLPGVGYTGNDMDINSNVTVNADIPYLTLDNSTQSAMLYTYNAGAFSVAASMTDDTGQDATYGVAAAYTFGNYTVGLGYEDDGTATQAELAGVATFGNTSVKAYYADASDRTLDTGLEVDSAYGIGVSSVFGATTVKGYVQKIDFSAGSAIDSLTWYGIGADYDLGGGATIAGGIADNDFDGFDPVADLGIKFKF